MQGNRLWFRVLGILTVLAFAAACSKKLMPPEIESMGSLAESEFEEVAEGMDATRGFAPGGPGSEESGFVRGENLADAGSPSGFLDSGDPGFVREESLSESGAIGEPIISDSGGNFNPFDHDDHRGTAEDDRGMQEARLFSFRPTSELKDIHFQFDKYDLDSRSKSVLKQNADFLKQHPSMKIEIQGHCDERGTNNYNLALGQRRAASTKRYLAALGIPENRVHVISYGEEKPFCPESSEVCWWRNRRAHFMVAE